MSHPVLMVTGATGALGGGVVRHLLARGADPARIAVLARDVSTARGFASLGVSIRQGSYGDGSAMRSALAGVERLLLVSATAFSPAAKLHASAIDAARDAGVSRIIYTAIENAAAPAFQIDQVSEWDRRTEAALATSGLDTIIVRHSLYADSLPGIIGDQVERGQLRAPAGDGRAAVVVRDDLAEANAALLLHDDPNASYTLTGPEAVSLPEIADAIGRGLERSVAYSPVSRDAYVALRAGDGVQASVAGFMAGWFEAIAAGAFPARDDIAAVLGRPPRSALAWLEDHYRREAHAGSVS